MKTYLILFTIAMICMVDPAWSAVEAHTEDAAFKPYSPEETDNPLKARMGLPKKESGFVRANRFVFQTKVRWTSGVLSVRMSC